jgi:hypothetical protein
MDAVSLASLERLVAIAGPSLLQYVSDSSPWTTDRTQAACVQILELAAQERHSVTHILRYLQKHHVRPRVLGSYPAHFTMMNYITIDCLLPRLIADEEKNLADIDRLLAATTDEEARSLIEAHRDLKRRQLQTLRELKI